MTAIAATTTRMQQPPILPVDEGSQSLVRNGSEDDALPFVSLRKLDGTITRTLSWKDAVASESMFQVRSLGQVVDEALQAFGYDSATMVLIQHAYEGAKNVGHFVRTVSKHGMPMREALWVWKHATHNDDFIG
ncbi:hypothetical protein NM688_g8041 [Phlebia brevispora]|uniref:Uncharacterized protein n=1 Tax=Phlebia brevispora TaxID=194682 RepID=A0ACC1RY68_9APHY|nr:hypothetical protein NM688_g8041 [Phlebia brevispora]